METSTDSGLLVVYTDGSSLGNPGPGGWAWWCAQGWASGGATHTTNNAMELLAIAEALHAVREAGHRGAVIHTDSRYSVDALTKWVHGWRKRSWKTAAGEPVANRDVIERIGGLAKGIAVEYRWVKGHAGHAGNERADDLARRQAEAWKVNRGRPAGPGFTNDAD